MEPVQATFGQRVSKILALILFIGSLVAWLTCGYFIVLATIVAFDPEAGDALIGVMYVDMFLLPVALISFLLTSALCHTSGKELSVRVKVLYIAPSFVAFLCGLAVFLRVFILI